MAGPGMFLTTDNGRADYGRGGPGFQIFPFMAIFSTNSTIYQSIRSFPKLTLYGTQSYVKWGGPVMRSLTLESPYAAARSWKFIIADSENWIW